MMDETIKSTPIMDETIKSILRTMAQRQHNTKVFQPCISEDSPDGFMTYDFEDTTVHTFIYSIGDTIHSQEFTVKEAPEAIW